MALTVHTMRLLFLVLICVISCGCRDDMEPQTVLPSGTKPQAAVKLIVLVVDDPEIAKGIRLLSGEWNERSGGELLVSEQTLAELLNADKLAADVVVYPSRHLGVLSMRNWLRPVRQSVLDDPALAWGDLLTVLRDQSVRYGGQVFALPLGEMPLVMAWRGEVPGDLPTTWEQLRGNAVRATSGELDSFPLTAELLARAVANTSPADRATLCFDAQNLDAKLNHPPLVRALEEMIQSPVEPAYAASVCLPRRAKAEQFTPLLGGAGVYNESLDQWDAADSTSPPVICGFSGRLASVTTVSRNAASAFKLLPWLVSGTTGAQLSQRSRATLWFRPSQAPQAQKWFDDKSSDEPGRWLTEMLIHGEAYFLPRIPGIDRYLAELESAISKALRDQQSAAKALAAVEARWDAITDELGHDQQQAAFRRHLGLTE